MQAQSNKTFTAKDMELEFAADACAFEGQRAAGGILIDTAPIPGGGHLQLVRHGQRFEIMFGEEQLIGSWDVCSEKALATLVCDRLGNRPERILIGGLGMGFTLAAARSALAPSVAIVVAELVAKVVGWAGGHLSRTSSAARWPIRESRSNSGMFMT